MHGDADGTSGRIARGVLHADVELTCQAVIRIGILFSMRLMTTGKGVVIAHRPLAVHRLGLHVRKLHSMHGLRFADD